jgi:hypothetical protein
LHPKLAEHGTNQFGKDRGGSNTTSFNELGRGETYTIARLKRDRPALAEKVIAGEMSAS